jgi:hypothetical protein
VPGLVTRAVVTYQTSRVDGLSCEAAFEEERSLWIPAVLHRSEELSVLQGVPALDYPEDMKGRPVR